MVSKVLGTWFRAWCTWYMVSRVGSTWFQEYGIHGLGGTGVRGT